jgi:hypothetical protein
MGWCGRAGCSPASVTLVRPLAFGSGSIPDKAGFTNPRSISQREINSSGRLDLSAAFPTNFDCFTHFLPHTSRWRLIVSTRLARTLASRPARRPLRLATRFAPCLKLIQQMAHVPALQLRLLSFCIDRREPIEAGVRIEAAERAKTDESKKVAFHCAAPMRTRRLDASALRGIAFRGHLTSLPAGGRSGRTENAREIPARSFRRAFSVRLRIIAANGERRNTGNSVFRCPRYRRGARVCVRIAGRGSGAATLASGNRAHRRTPNGQAKKTGLLPRLRDAPNNTDLTVCCGRR